MALHSSPAQAPDHSLRKTVKRLGREAGFDLVRIAGVEVLTEARQRYVNWISEGRHGDMAWITSERAHRSSDPRTILSEARSVITVASGYWSGHRPQLGKNAGQIARYAWSRDYHQEMADKLQQLAGTLEAHFEGEYRCFVDTGPLMDKALAARSGIGWYGKNTNILTEGLGSFVFLGEIVTTLPLPADPPVLKDCGSCSLCQVACPTGALAPDYAMDARKCISYLTIEHRGPIPIEYREAIGSWVFGCDICQDVCPPTMRPYLHTSEQKDAWTREVRAAVMKARGSTPQSMEPAEDHRTGTPAQEPADVRSSVDLLWLLSLTHEQYLTAFRGTAIRRAKDWMLRRNAAVALGNVGSPEAFGPLCGSLAHDVNPIVRGHAAWALGRMAERARDAPIHDRLAAALGSEEDESVRAEILAAQQRAAARDLTAS